MDHIAHPRWIAGRYGLAHLLGRGGMGSVWAARRRDDGQLVAVKLMTPAQAASLPARRRFAREAQAAMRLRSLHVVAVLDYGIDGDVPFIVMELLTGEDLRARLRRKRRLTIAAAAQITAQTCAALELAHGAGIVHRDLKPANVFLARVGDREVVKILDFGLAFDVDPDEASEHAEGVLLGSPHYMSPEQARGRPLDHRTDLWSLGVLIYRMLTGAKPFGGITVTEVLLRICTDPVPSARAVVPELPPGIDAFFERALARDPGARFQSAHELGAAFAEVVGSEAERREALTIPPPMEVLGESVPPPPDDDQVPEADDTDSFDPQHDCQGRTAYRLAPSAHHSKGLL
ncbi:MAG: serine/threonine protein kinase [Polyangiaceae bacterium]|nr:serine/threonine protein kinase [Polyangiaceae bacterium]